MRRKPWQYPAHTLLGRAALAFFAMWEAGAILTGWWPTISATVWHLRNTQGAIPVVAILVTVTTWLWHHFLYEGPKVKR